MRVHAHACMRCVRARARMLKCDSLANISLVLIRAPPHGAQPQPCSCVRVCVRACVRACGVCRCHTSTLTGSKMASRCCLSSLVPHQSLTRSVCTHNTRHRLHHTMCRLWHDGWMAWFFHEPCFSQPSLSANRPH